MTLRIDDALALRRVNADELRAFADPAFEAGTGMFGGWTAALLLKAALEQSTGDAPISITTNFVSRIQSGGDVTVRTRMLGASRSLSHTQAEIHAADGGLCASALIVTASRRASDGFLEARAPAAPHPEGLPAFHPPAPFGASVETRAVAGYPPFQRDSTNSTAWIRGVDGARLDHPRLAYFADATPPRIFFISDGPRLSSTVTMSVYFHGSEEEIAAAGADFILSEVAGVRAEQSIFSHAMRLWSRSGALLATSEQLCWFR